MKKIELFERAIAEQAGSLKDYRINGTMFWAYRRSLDVGNDLIDFNKVIWDEDIEAITEIFEANNIAEFTISSTFSGLIPILAAFDKKSYKVAGVTEVKAPYSDFQTGKNAIIPALHLVRA